MRALLRHNPRRPPGATRARGGARDAGTYGFEKDPHREIRPWRDWVIRAFNDNLPFDQCTIKQPAGDQLETPTAGDLLATAFHRNTQNHTEGGTGDEEFRAAAMVDRVNTTWTAWQATTFGCVQYTFTFPAPEGLTTQRLQVFPDHDDPTTWPCGGPASPNPAAGRGRESWHKRRRFTGDTDPPGPTRVFPGPPLGGRSAGPEKIVLGGNSIPSLCDLRSNRFRRIP